MGLPEEISRLAQLHADGALTDAQYEAAKEKLLGAAPASSRGDLGVSVRLSAWWLSLSSAQVFKLIGAAILLIVILGFWITRPPDVTTFESIDREVEAALYCQELYANGSNAYFECIDLYYERNGWSEP